MKPIIGLGAGGHAKALIETIRLRGEYQLAGLLDPDLQKWGTQVLGVPVLGDDRLLSELASQGICHAFIGLGGTKNTKPRQSLYQKAVEYGFKLPSIVHPSAIISPSARIGPGANILLGAIINADARLGQNVIINSGAIVEHDCVIEDHVHIASGAQLAGGVSVGAGAHIGLGASVRQEIRIGEKAIVGAGAVVVKDVPSNVVAVGVPANTIPENVSKTT